jgi:hypothetical protein
MAASATSLDAPRRYGLACMPASLINYLYLYVCTLIIPSGSVKAETIARAAGDTPVEAVDS